VIRTGARIFFADNSKDYLGRCDVFARVATGLGLTPIVWGGAGLAVRHSNQDGAIRDDFYSAQAVVLYFGSPNDGSNHEDHWVLPELRHRIASGVGCILYASENFPISVFQKYGYAGEPRVLSGGDDFGSALQYDVQELIADHS
jgi:hypothetical protein